MHSVGLGKTLRFFFSFTGGGVSGNQVLLLNRRQREMSSPKRSLHDSAAAVASRNRVRLHVNLVVINLQRIYFCLEKTAVT